MKKGRGLEIFKLVTSIILCQGAGLIGSFFTRPAIPVWYASLKKPIFTPPDWVFAPVWITLYFLMGVAGFLVWQKGLKHTQVRIGLFFFSAQLVLNALWSYLFFGLRAPLAGFAEILVLCLAVLLTLQSFFRVSYIAGFLLIPYFLWVTLAVVLNLFIWLYN